MTNTLSNNEQRLYGSFHQSMLFMLSELYSAVEDMTNPEDATRDELTRATIAHSKIAAAYNVFINQS